MAFDPKSNLEGATGAVVVASRIFWTSVSFQAEYFISELRREQLSVDSKATFTPPSGIERAMKLEDLGARAGRAARQQNGAYRVVASRLLRPNPEASFWPKSGPWNRRMIPGGNPYKCTSAAWIEDGNWSEWIA